MKNKDAILKIRSLIKTGIKENILIANEISSGLNISFKEISLPWTDIMRLSKNLDELKELKQWDLIEAIINIKEVHFNGQKAASIINATDVLNDLDILKNLESLILENIELTSLPKSIGKMQKLKTLAIFSNKLSDISPGVFCLKNLKELYFHENQISTIPKEIEQLSWLRKYGHKNTRKKLN